MVFKIIYATKHKSNKKEGISPLCDYHFWLCNERFAIFKFLKKYFEIRFNKEVLMMQSEIKITF